jgi:hypothetical protein
MVEEFPIRIAPGTQVVAGPRGTGVVVSCSETGPIDYLVRFPSGDEDHFERSQIRIRKHVQSDALGPSDLLPSLVDELLTDWVVLRCVTGSRAYGLDDEHSDTDIRGVFVSPPDLLWSIRGAPEYLERGEMEAAYWELRKFCVLALKANPNILECLNSPLILETTGIGEELLTIRSAFLSRLVHQTFNGYVMSQFKKLERDIRNGSAPKWKHAMHLIRLLISGITLLSTGAMEVRVTSHRDKLLAIRNGEMPWEQVENWRLFLHGEFDSALTSSPLPEMPDTERIDRFLIESRRSVARGRQPR